ncbi:aminotransferase class I/II-fold pyridoxal phosphate-dependent enzyme [Marininema halotolerans]|uniref:Arginine/lysine/ornithine decarboxylase n=1 Tax=Marininema halotolerans TaxID=1155944 RepID=A0A1I6TDJ7_9BACL|nr:aminotransferase class I/II-fold pyridoxal phosphate-dependent enzyme [Marininema halotolerans]SFS87279.1 Arginine/lysine/ornithine decarboxylase [Marininema halotolerans]
MERQRQAPLFEALVAHQKQSQGNFHVPGHKQGIAFDPEGRKWFGAMLQIDLTEVGELDDLHQPEGVIDEAQELAAEAFGAERSYFLTGGTTAGNLALVMALCKPGEKLIVQRDSHQSIFNGCALAKVRPIYLSGKLQKNAEKLLPLRSEDLEQALAKYNDIRGVFITSPDYFGRVQPVRRLAEVCHRYGVPLIVDEAHGAHFSFHPKLPPSAMMEGADASVQSTHKMLPAMTMASMLHVRGTRVDQQRLTNGLRMIQSSSPSYPMLASLDLARRWMVAQGSSMLAELLGSLQVLRDTIASLKLVEEIPGEDPLKLTLQARNGVSGLTMFNWLRDRHVYFELADHRRLLATFSVGTTVADLRALCDRLRELDQAVAKMKATKRAPNLHVPVMSESEVCLGEPNGAQEVEVPLREALGYVAASMIVPYPPGIPLVLPGERISIESIQVIEAIIKEGGRVRGLGASFPPRVVVLQ